MRNIRLINKNWLFKKGQSAVPDALDDAWDRIDLPYTWNGIDGQDGGNDYYRGKGCFIKEILKDDFPQGEEYYIQLDGVNSSAEVYFNGKRITAHHGGYSAFRAKLSDVKENNIIAVIADNSPNDFVYPQFADFTFYGGIYRDVKLIGVSKSHFDLDYYAAAGVMVTPEIKGSNAEIKIKSFVTNPFGCYIQYKIFDGETVIAECTAAADSSEAVLSIENVHLWDGIKDPYLYTAKAVLYAESDDQEHLSESAETFALDEISVRFGCRSFEVDAQRGFILNGREYPLRGVSRHQDRPEIGNALTYAHHREDVELICEMGANTVRLAHYQHAQDFYDLCDEKGLIVWAEIPYISKHLPNGIENTKSQMTELICQNYNHPCIVTWGLSNEITMNGAADKSLVENHRMLNELAHSLDKTRLTTVAVVTLCDMDEEYVHISDIVSYNHYFGWYGGNVDMYGPWFDHFHKKYPKRAIGISEYGCEALNWHTSEPEQGDYTEEYQTYYHEELIKQISQRPYLWATHVWNMFDFAADARAEGGENGMNHKGLVTFDRKYKKDSFYAYKAWLSDEPFVHICGKRYVRRAEEVTKVTVYSNQDEVELFVNGVSAGKQKKGQYPFFYFHVNNSGKSELVAQAGSCTDKSQLEKVESFDESYRMKEEGGVINWFEIDAPDGYFSVNDTLGSVMSTFKGKLFLLKLAKVLLSALSDGKAKNKETPSAKKMPKARIKSDGISVMGFSINKTILELGKGFSIKRVFMMLGGGKITKEQILAINKSLNKIKKPNK